jgi:hypothetical protein
LDRLIASLATLETLLWVLASVAAFAAFLIFAPSFFNAPAAPSTTTASQFMATSRPTLTPVPSATSMAFPQALTPDPLPTLAPDAQSYEFIADPTQSGWIVTGDQKPHWADRNLHSGNFKGKGYQSLLYFDLTQLPLGSKVLFAEVELTGLSRDNLGANGSWRLELLKPGLIPGWADRAAADFSAAATEADIGSALGPSDLSLEQVNQFVFASSQLPFLESAINTSGIVTFLMDGSAESGDSLFTWDGGGLDLKTGEHPVIRLIAIPAQFVIVANPPTPENVMTAAAQAQTATAFATRYGTPTPFPRNFATATPAIYVTAQPTPANVETRVALAEYATAVALTTGTFTPTPVNWIVVTPNPTGYPTVTPVPTWTPPAVAIATVLSGLTPSPTPTPELSAFQLLQTPVADFINGNIPFKSNIIFLSDRPPGDSKTPTVLLMKPDGTLLAVLNGVGYYNLVAVRDSFSPDRTKQVRYLRDSKGIQQIGFLDVGTGLETFLTAYPKGVSYDAAWSPGGGLIAYVSTETGGDEIYVYDLALKVSRRLTDSTGLGYPWNKHPSWSPDGQKIVFWSNRSGHQQIWMMNADGTGLMNLSSSAYNDSYPVWVKP